MREEFERALNAEEYGSVQDIVGSDLVEKLGGSSVPKATGVCSGDEGRDEGRATEKGRASKSGAKPLPRRRSS